MCLSQLERCVEALQAEQEATEIRRQLAMESPNAFQPDLARSLSRFAARLEENGRVEDALVADREAIKAITLAVLAVPAAFVPDARLYVRDYWRRCGVAGVKVDAGLLGPLLPYLEVAEGPGE
jgi:hypothetical protein